MNIWGKLIGAATGFALSGPEGALVGALAGHAVDMYTTWAESYSGSSYRVRGGSEAENAARERRNPSSRYNFTLSVVSLAAKLAKADGPVTRQEIAAFKEVFRVPQEELHNVGYMFDRARASPGGYEPYARQLVEIFQDNHATLDEIVNCLFHVALADGALRPEEIDFIRRVARIFGFSESYFQRRLEEQSGTAYYHQNTHQEQGAKPEPAVDPYAILGMPSTAADKDIKAKYRTLVRENHPDNLVAAGKSRDAVAQATAKLARINAAYDQILKERHVN